MQESAKQLSLTKSGVKELSREHTDRITDDAIRRVMYEERRRIDKIFRLASELADHRGRETVTEDDVNLVYKMEEEL